MSDHDFIAVMSVTLVSALLVLAWVFFVNAWLN
jgi:hypothetical protein